MHDAVVDGVSLVSNYRAQFLQVIRETSYTGLLGRIQARTLLSKTFERPYEPEP
jgi:ABC-type transporter MlaC component